MADETVDPLSRRDFVALGVAAGLAAVAGSASASEVPLTETTVAIKTPDGMCDAAFIHPASGSYPAVILWPDAFGLRPSMRTMGKRLALEGYSVLVPNPFYRVAPKAPPQGIFDAKTFNFANPDDRAKLQPLMASIGAPGTAEKDLTAFVRFLDTQKSVNRAKKIGTQGYCMGGPLVFRTLAAMPNRIGAGGSFHGGGLVTDQPTSPHLLIPKMKGRLYVAVASNDDKQQPDAKDKLKAAFAAAHVPAEIEVYPSLHGWCVPDMPSQAGAPIYNRPDAEKAWSKLVSLYKAALV